MGVSYDEWRVKRLYDRFDWETTECEDPTDAVPGSAEKVEVLRQRLETGQSLWCNEDAKPDLR